MWIRPIANSITTISEQFKHLSAASSECGLRIVINWLTKSVSWHANSVSELALCALGMQMSAAAAVFSVASLFKLFFVVYFFYGSSPMQLMHNDDECRGIWPSCHTYFTIISHYRWCFFRFCIFCGKVKI